MNNFPTNDDIEIGDKVLIERKKDQGTGNFTEGIVKLKLTLGYSHPHGIMVDLENGERGRVKQNLSRSITGREHRNRINKIKEELKNLRDTKLLLEKKSNENKLSEKNFELVDLDKKNVPKTEDVFNEFKEFYQYDVDFENWKDTLPKNIWEEKISNETKKIKKRFSIVVASFGNSKKGGFLYLGIDSRGNVVGLERDKEFAKFIDYEDTFANSIRETLENLLRERVFLISKIQMKFTQRDGKMICILEILPSDFPIWIYNKINDNGEFYVRGSSPRAEFLNMKDSLTYIKGRFPNFLK